MPVTQRYTTEQIVAKSGGAERLQGQGSTIRQVCRRLGISEQSAYRWHRAFRAEGGQGAAVEGAGGGERAVEADRGRPAPWRSAVRRGATDFEQRLVKAMCQLAEQHPRYGLREGQMAATTTTAGGPVEAVLKWPLGHCHKNWTEPWGLDTVLRGLGSASSRSSGFRQRDHRDRPADAPHSDRRTPPRSGQECERVASHRCPLQVEVSGTVASPKIAQNAKASSCYGTLTQPIPSGSSMD